MSTAYPTIPNLLELKLLLVTKQKPTPTQLNKSCTLFPRSLPPPNPNPTILPRSLATDTEPGSLEAMTHPRCVGWGEIGLDYHYENSPRSLQQDIFARQLRHAVRLGKPLTIHTREAEDDTERILKAEVPKDHRVS